MEQMSTKERILKSAAEVFAEKGLKARIEDIAERAPALSGKGGAEGRRGKGG